MEQLFRLFKEATPQPIFCPFLEVSFPIPHSSRQAVPLSTCLCVLPGITVQRQNCSKQMVFWVPNRERNLFFTRLPFLSQSLHSSWHPSVPPHPSCESTGRLGRSSSTSLKARLCVPKVPRSLVSLVLAAPRPPSFCS